MTGLPSHGLDRAFASLRHRVKRRETAIVFLVALPIAIAAMALAWRFGGVIAGVALAIIALLGAATFAWQRSRHFDSTWLVRRLDDTCPQFEDSTALLLSPDAPATTLQALQRARLVTRVEQTFASSGMPELRKPYPRPVIAAAWLLSALVVAAVVAWPTARTSGATESVAEASAAPKAAIKVVDAAVTIAAPEYTGLAQQTVLSLDVKAPVDSKLAWSLRFDRDPTAAAFVFHDGVRLALERDGSHWKAERLLAASTLYRVEVDGNTAPADERASRLDAVADQPPEITVREPERTLTLLTDAQKTWDFAFEAHDDYGLGAAELTVSLAQGSGEQIKVTEQKFVLDGGSDRHARQYKKSLDLAALGFARGDDLIVRLDVADNHEPQANHSSSSSFILRWPPEKSTESAGLEGPVQKMLPAYFRSERQIIIDTEALIPKRDGLGEAAFAKQSDELGVDQKVLRLRYGEFLGEGFESLAENAPTGSSAKAQPDAQSSGKTDKSSADDNAPAKSLKDVPPERESGAAKPAAGLGHSEDVLHEFGHAHDNAEAATLLDPETRRILKAALDEMWQAELNLRQAKPEAALPYEYKALDYIKQVQQAERIYLARAGVELPQVDLTRRLSGERKGLDDRTAPVPVAEASDSPVPGIVAALEHDGVIDTGALDGWIKAHPDATPDSLGLLAAADRVQREPDCGNCRAELKARLWPLLPVPPTALRARRLPDAAGAAYLDALGTPAGDATP